MAVQFRRIGGRIVPIHPKVEGAKKVALGAAVAAGTGVAAAKMHREAAHYLNAAKTQKAGMLFHRAQSGTKAKVMAKGLRKAAAKSFTAARRLDVIGKRVQRGGLVAAAGLIGAGTDALLPEKAKRDTRVRALIDTGAGAGGAVLSRAAYYKAIAPGSIGTKGMQAFKLAAKRVLIRGIRL